VRKQAAAVLLSLTALLLAAAPASALPPVLGAELEFQVGRECAANGGVPNTTLVPREANPLNVRWIAVPHDGVLTRWQLRFQPPAGEEGARYPETLKVMRAVEGSESPEQEVAAESAQETVVSGRNTFSARIPVEAGEVFGLYGGPTTPTLFCEMPGEEEEQTAYGATQGNLTVGTRSIFNSGPTGSQVPVLATVEADLDGDGFGDVSQDRCPASAATHGPCPTLHARWQVKRKAIVVWVSAAKPTTVTVYGEARWHFKPKRKPGHTLPKGTPLIVGLDGGGTKTVQRRPATAFRLKLGRTVLRRLNRLTTGESVQARVTLVTAAGGGRAHHQLLRFRLHGRR
jgi:hypothetical protein